MTSLKLALISTYPPQKCGIGTFSHNLIKSIADNLGYNNLFPNISVVAVKDQLQDYNHPPEVNMVIERNNQRDYISAAKYINYNRFDACIIGHEFGIYGGINGVYILSLIRRLEIPFIITFHTVIKNPSYVQKEIIREISKKAFKVVVMSNRAVEFLTDIYNISPEKIELIEHGVPVNKVFHTESIRDKFNFEDNTVLLTFGLLSRNKGIETVIKALPEVVKEHKKILYIVLGNTHPNILREGGEEYREYLLRLVKENNLEDHVYFYNRFVTEEHLMEYLYSIDIYISPHLNEEQITSGTLSYAVGAGAAVISTPYWHAQELLNESRGILFDFNNSLQLASILNNLLDNPQKIKSFRYAALEYGEKLKWPKIGAKYINVLRQASQNFSFVRKEKSTILEPLLLPDFTLDHINKLTDDTGIVQHAKYGIPNLKEGYCLDDNARALLMVSMVYNIRKSTENLNLMTIYLSYINYMQNEDGSFKNFLSFNRNFVDEVGSEDSFGRTIWALGYTINHAPNESYQHICLDIFNKSIPFFNHLKSLRGIANTIIGITHYMKSFPPEEKIMDLIKDLTYKLINIYLKEKSDDWNWFENILTYDNAIISLSLLHSFEIIKDDNILNVAKESSFFLEKTTLKSGYLSPVGNNGWYKKGGECSVFAQQSVDVMGMVLLFFKAYQVTKEKSYLDKMFTSYMWYLGKNAKQLPVYDFKTGGCNDGLEEYGINKNQGAESTIAYLISHLTVLNAFELEFEYEK